MNQFDHLFKPSATFFHLSLCRISRINHVCYLCTKHKLHTKIRIFIHIRTTHGILNAPPSLPPPPKLHTNIRIFIYNLIASKYKKKGKSRKHMVFLIFPLPPSLPPSLFHCPSTPLPPSPLLLRAA